MSTFKHDFKALQVEGRIQQLRVSIAAEQDPLLMAHHIAELQTALSERTEIATQRIELALTFFTITLAIILLVSGLCLVTALFLLGFLEV